MAPALSESPDAAAAAERSPRDRGRFFDLLEASLAQGHWLKLVLAGPKGAEPGLLRITARPLTLRGQACLSFVYSYETRDITKNLPAADGLAQLQGLVGTSFRNAHLLTPEKEIQLRFSKRGQAHLSIARLAPEATQAAATETPHDREKQRWLALDRPFLVTLGVTTAQHQLVPAMARKWKQINKFIEIFAHALASSPLAGARRLEVIDFGAGKGYLTFAIHEWLRQTQGIEAQVTGVELRPELVAAGNDAVAQIGLQGLRFEQGDVHSVQPAALNVMIALHACDTATDLAIHLGLRAGADIILCSPCCHKQIRPQLLSPHPLRPVFQHGIHLEQQAEMVTDSLRALLLEAQGYETQVFEFVALEHTRKNKMILAIKRRTARPPEAALVQIRELKQFFGIREQCLETLLLADRQGSATAP